MGKIKVTLPLILSVFLSSLLILILILVAIGFRNSDSGQSENPSWNFNQNLKETSEPTGQTGENGDPDPDSDDGIFDSELITSCSVAMEILPSPRSPKQWIYPHGNGTKVEVLCDFQVNGGGWTVIQKRSSGPQLDFDRNWTEYSNGFGSLDGNFWLGLDNIHALTKNGDQELRIELEDFEGEKKWAKYGNFSISDASDFYRLNMSGFSPDSTAGDSMTNKTHDRSYVLNGMRFSTEDKDNDNYSGVHCANGGWGGWWYNQCAASRLNGPYEESGSGIFWRSWKGFDSLAKTEIKIRTRKSQ